MRDLYLSPNDMIQKLKEREESIPSQRITILKILAESTDHPSVEHIYQQVKINFPKTSTAPVYKTIMVLKEVVEVLEIRFWRWKPSFKVTNMVQKAAFFIF